MNLLSSQHRLKNPFTICDSKNVWQMAHLAILIIHVRFRIWFATQLWNMKSNFLFVIFSYFKNLWDWLITHAIDKQNHLKLDF